MLIRASGYNDGVKEYLEEGVKNGRDYTREELDERVILHGDLDLTQLIYQQIPDKGQDRYITFTLSFREDEISNETLLNITQEFRQFLMYAYNEDEYNFYAEAHLPKIKEVTDKKTGESIVRKPHIHIVVPKVNILSNKMIDPVGSNFGQSVKHIEAFQEYINQKYYLASPREHIRVDPTNVADVLSRYKGDDFNKKNKEFKKQLVSDVISSGINSREQFYSYVSTFGETKVRNMGKENEYIAVKLPGDAKFTNLKETIFQDDFIVRRELKKSPLDKAIIRDRLMEWPQRAKEIKYVSKATPKFRQLYKAATPEEKINLLAQRQTDFYEKYRGQHDLHPAEWQRDNQRGIAETERGGTAQVAYGVQGLSGCNVATDRNGGEAKRAVLLPGDAYLYLGQQKPGGSTGLRHDLPAGRGRRNAGEHDFDKFTAIPGIATVAESAGRRGYRVRDGMGGGDSGSLDIPPYALNPHRVAGMEAIEKRGSRLFGRHDTRAKFDTVRLLRRVMPKPDKNASFVAAYFLRQYEQNQILPEHRREIRTVDKQFFTARRTILSDDRLTRNEKTQYVSILTFERLKAHHAIRHPDIPFKQENAEMGSADIRKLIKSPRLPENSISGIPEEDKDISPARERFAQIIQNINEHMAEKRNHDRQRLISPDDLYTKKAKLSKNVHYLDKKTDRTLFVDIGKAIAVRKGGMTDSAVAVALELAKEKFGSTLTIKGSQKFKDQVVEVAAKNNLDMHFTDKAMNKLFEERKAEIAIEKGGQRIEQPDTGKAPTQEKTADESTVDEKIRETVSTEENTQNATQPERAKTAEVEKQNIHEGVLLAHGAAAYKFKPDLNKPEDKRDDSYFVKLQMADGKTKTLWGVGLENAVNGLQNGERVKLEDRGVEHVKWQEEQKDGSFIDKSGQRRIWEGSPLDRERENDKEITTQERQSSERVQDNDEPEYDL